MKILHVDETFHPAFGYQCNPLAKFQRKQGNDVYIIAPDKDHIYPVYADFGDHGERLPEQDLAYEAATDVSIVRVPGKRYVAGRLVYDYSKLFEAIETINPDVMLVHCLETLTAARVMMRYKDRYPMVFDSHMLSMASNNKLAFLYEALFKRTITKCIVREGFKVIKTQDDDYVSSRLGVPEQNTKFISFGTDTDLFVPDGDMKRRFLEEKQLPESSFVVVSTGKLSEAKGGMLLAEAIKEKFDMQRPVVFVVVANFDGEYEQKVKGLLGQSENPILYYPVQSYLELPYFYQIADVSVYPAQCSMSFYDSESCGTPVISESNNINEERNSHNNGLCFEARSASSLRSAIMTIGQMSDSAYQSMRKASRDYIMSGFSYEDIAAEYTKELEAAVEHYSKGGSRS